jgi:hypothetical protein
VEEAVNAKPRRRNSNAPWSWTASPFTTRRSLEEFDRVITNGNERSLIWRLDRRFLNVASKLFGAAPAGRAGTVEPELVKIAAEAIVEAVDPRLRVVSGYQRKIETGVVRTILHMRELAKELPHEPIELSRDAWGADQQLNAFFATAADVPATLGRSAPLRAYFESPVNAGAADAYALLGMLKIEREVFAPALVDGVLRHDVAQTTVSFSNHTLIAPAPDVMALPARSRRADIQAARCAGARAHYIVGRARDRTGAAQSDARRAPAAFKPAT